MLKTNTDTVRRHMKHSRLARWQEKREIILRRLWNDSDKSTQWLSVYLAACSEMIEEMENDYENAKR